jgi:hypothetical protein
MTSDVPVSPDVTNQASEPGNQRSMSEVATLRYLDHPTKRDDHGKWRKGQFRPGHTGRPKGVKNKAPNEVRVWSRLLLESTTYRRALTKRIIAGTAPQIEVLLYHYAYGKPKETVELQASESMAGLLTLALGGAMLGALASGSSQGILERSEGILDVSPTPESSDDGEGAPEPRDPVESQDEAHDPPGSSDVPTT